MTQHSKNGEGVEDRATDYEKAYFERGLFAGYAWMLTKRPGEELSDAVVDHAWEHRDEGMGPTECLPTRQSLAREPATADVGRLTDALKQAAIDLLLTPRSNRDGKADQHIEESRNRIRDALYPDNPFALSRAAPLSGHKGDENACSYTATDLAGDLSPFRGIADHHILRPSLARSSGHAMAEGEQWRAVLEERANVACDAECDGDRGLHDIGCIRATALLATTPPTTNDAIPAGLREAFGGSMMLETVRDGLWSLQFAFGKGDSACDNMRAAADAWRAALSAAPSAPATEAGEEA